VSDASEKSAPLSMEPAPSPPAPAQPAPTPAPPEPVLNLRDLAGQRFKLVDKPRFRFELPKKAPPDLGSLRDWAIKKGAPAWLAEAMAAGQPVNKLWAESEFDELAAKTAGLTLGRKGA